MLGPGAVPANDTRATLRATTGPVGVTHRDRRIPSPGRIFAVSRLARAVEAQLDDAGGDLTGAVAAGVAGDAELGGEGIEAALGGALGDVELGGDLGAGGGAAGEGALGAVGSDEGGGGRALLLVEGDRGLAGG